MTLLEYCYEDPPRRRRRLLYKPKTETRENIVVVSSGFALDVSVNVARRLEKLFPAISRAKQFAPYFAKLDQLTSDKTLWVEDADPPAPATVEIARAILRQLETEALEPTKIIASVEGGVGICFVDGERYADIECFNSGEILGVVSNRHDRPTIWKIDPTAVGFAEATTRIRSFLGRAARSNDAR